MPSSPEKGLDKARLWRYTLTMTKPKYDELSLLNFITNYIRCEAEPVSAHWLCTDGWFRGRAVEEALRRYEEWKAVESNAEEGRERIKPSVKLRG